MRNMPKLVALVGTVALVLAAATSQFSAAPVVRGFQDRLIVSAPRLGLSAADRAVYQKLDGTIVSFTFNEQPLEEAIDFLGTLGNLNIVLDRRKVEAGKTITLKLTNVTLTTAVKLITEQVGLKWVVREGVVFISDEEGTTQEPVTLVYDVSDFLAVPPDFQGPNIELQNITGNRGGRGSTGTGGGGIWEDQTGSAKEKESAKTRDELLQDLVDLIQSVIEPGTWEEAGGATK